jgi:hypothetical protein
MNFSTFYNVTSYSCKNLSTQVERNIQARILLNLAHIFVGLGKGHSDIYLWQTKFQKHVREN